MANMSYCRFRNTLNDLQDCISAMEESLYEEAEEKLDIEEKSARDEIIWSMVHFFEEAGIEIMGDDIDALIERMNKAEENL